MSPGTFSSQRRRCDGESSGSISVVVRDGSVRLDYRLGQGQPIVQLVYFSWTRPQFGGRKRWFLCPLCTRSDVGAEGPARLVGDRSGFEFPDKPRGMH